MFLKFNKDEIKTGTLKDIVSAKHVEEINGVDALEIETLDIDVEKGYRVVYKDRYGNFKEFIVTEIEEQNFGGGIIKRLYCESSLYETLGDYIEDKRPQNVTANTALANALLTTRWEVGTVDDLGLNSTNFYHISAKEAIQKVAEAFKGEIRTRIIVSGKEITHRYVDLLARRGGDYGKRFTYTKNLESVTKTVHSDDVVTALYGYGKGEEVGDGYGRRLDFADINDGKAYVEDLTALEIWGRNNTGGTKSHVFGKVEFDDVEDKTKLLTLTTDKLAELSEPKITYEANVIDLGGADLGDDVVVIDKEFTPELRLKARVIEVRRDLLETQNDEITLGNFMPSVVDSLNRQDSYISSFRDKQGVWDRSNTINPDGTINAQFLNNLVGELNTRMNSQGGYVFISDDGKGLTTYDAPSPETATMAIQLLGGAFRIANSKLPDGSFDWRTFGDGNGFVADSFIGGLLKGGKVEFDLTNGTLLIGNSVEDYQLYFDGSVLKLNGLGIESYASKVELTNAVNAVETNTKNLFVLNDIEATGVTVETNGISIDQQESTSNTSEYALGLATGQEYSAQAIVSLVTGTANANYGKVVLANPITSAEITIVNGGADGVSQTNFIAPSDIADYTDLIFYGVLDGVVSVSQIQIVKGSLIPKWALSYEDVQARIDGKVGPDQLNYEVSVLQSSIQQTSDSILQTVSETISDSEANITAQYSAEVQLAKDEFNVQLSQTNDSITDINNELADIGRYLNFDIAQGLMIGLEDSDGTARMLLDGKSLQFLDDGSGSVEDIVLHEDAVAYIGGKKLYINEAEILEKIRIGNHQMEKYSTGITIFKYVG